MNWILAQSIPVCDLTFLNSVESELFCNNKRKKVDDNLSDIEREALNNWRKDNDWQGSDGEC